MATASSIAGAIAQVEREAPDVLIFDRMLPDGDGLELCGRMRAEPRFVDVALLVLSALGSESDRVEGLELGADDYVVKPFGVRELVARVRLPAALAVDRRLARASGRKGAQLRWRDLIVDVDSQRALIGTREIDLRPRAAARQRSAARHHRCASARRQPGGERSVRRARERSTFSDARGLPAGKDRRARGVPGDDGPRIRSLASYRKQPFVPFVPAWQRSARLSHVPALVHGATHDLRAVPSGVV